MRITKKNFPRIRIEILKQINVRGRIDEIYYKLLQIS